MVFNINNQEDRWQIVDKILYEPKIGNVKVRPLCYLVALLFIAEDVLMMYLTNVNFYQTTNPYYSHVEFPVNFALRIVSITSAICLIYGIQMQRSTAIAIFLWTQFEINMVYVPFYCYKAIEKMLQYGEDYQFVGTFFIKCALWWMVNSVHNYIKECELIEKGIIRKSIACTEIIRYRLPGQKTSI